MGSLMAGWDSPISDPKSAKYTRNMSLTKGEINAYWNLKKKIHDEHLQAVSPRSHELEGANLPVRSRSLPSVVGSSAVMEEERQNLEKILMKKKNEEEEAEAEAGWWRRSNWAFLNEPPVMEQTSNTYAAQYHIATAN